MHSALTAAIAALTPRERLRLGCYYAQDMTLAAIGKMLGEHEGTVSRHLTRTRASLHVAIDAALCDAGLDEAGRAECFRSVMDDAGPIDLAEMVGDPSTALRAGPSTPLRAGPSTPLRAGKVSGQDRSR
jgi:DNA-binding CsgD family transcriptional regulator